MDEREREREINSYIVTKHTLLNLLIIMKHLQLPWIGAQTKFHSDSRTVDNIGQTFFWFEVHSSVESESVHLFLQKTNGPSILQDTTR